MLKLSPSVILMCEMHEMKVSEAISIFPGTQKKSAHFPSSIRGKQRVWGNLGKFPNEACYALVEIM